MRAAFETALGSEVVDHFEEDGEFSAGCRIIVVGAYGNKRRTGMLRLTVLIEQHLREIKQHLYVDRMSLRFCIKHDK